MTGQSPHIHEILKQLDEQPQEVTSWESDFLEHVLRQRRPLSEKQYAVVVRMCEKYLAPGVAEELRGQMRLMD